MAKKLIFVLIVVLILVGGGFFWWQNQADVRGLNKNLPEGVRVVKSLLGNEYKVVNKIDRYEFKVPEGWEGIAEIEYIPEREETGYKISSIEIAGQEGFSRIVIVNHFQIKEDVNLKLWAEANFETFGLIGDFDQENINGINIVKTQEEVHLLGMWVYFFKNNSAVYAVTNGSEEFIRYIISSGKW